MILLIDNYDSFTYNIVQRLGELNPALDIRVVRNDVLTAEEIRALAPSHLLISPGPGTPDDAGVSVAAIRAVSGMVPILGVCLGHQAVCAAFGGRIVHAPRLMHGKADRIRIEGPDPLLDGLPNPLTVGRYHSLAADPGSLPSCLTVTCRAGDGTIMGVRHRTHPTYGIQFHPESILTPDGTELLRKFLLLGSGQIRP